MQQEQALAFSHRRLREISNSFIKTDRPPFSEVAVTIRLRGNGSSETFTLDYIIEFTATIEEVLFAFAETDLIAESLQAMSPAITEITVIDSLQEGIHTNLQQIEVVEYVAGSRCRIDWEIVDPSDADEILGIGSRLSANQYALARATLTNSPAVDKRIEIRMNREIPYAVSGIPWVADRLLFLRSITVDSTHFNAEYEIVPYTFLGGLEHAHEIGSWDSQYLRFTVNHWIASGHGLMVVWIPKP